MFFLLNQLSCACRWLQNDIFFGKGAVTNTDHRQILQTISCAVRSWNIDKSLKDRARAELEPVKDRIRNQKVLLLTLEPFTKCPELDMKAEPPCSEDSDSD